MTAIQKSMEVLSALNTFGATSMGVVDECMAVCSGKECEEMWKSHCCGKTAHLDCVECHMLKNGTSVCPGCSMPFHGKTIKNRRVRQVIASEWIWTDVDWFSGDWMGAEVDLSSCK